jgi:hypothetical protein
VQRLGDAEVLAVIESMNGARFVHDQLELAGWDVRLADPQRARALAPLACQQTLIAHGHPRPRVGLFTEKGPCSTDSSCPSPGWGRCRRASS